MKIPDFIQAALIGLKTGCALVDLEGRIVEHDLLFPVWTMGEQRSLVGWPLLDVLPELVGQEESLENVSQGQSPFFRLDHLNRRGPNQEALYLMVTVIIGEPGAGIGLNVLVTDVTEQGQYIQELMQHRNELHLTRRKLADLSYQLDYLLRHYLPAEVADALLKGELQPQLGGELRQVSILFADVRGFTTLSEQLAPEQIVYLLNEYLDVIAEAVEEFGGVVSQYQGDNIMVMFNASTAQPDHAQRAVQTGLALQQAVAHHRAQNLPAAVQLEFGVGVNSGPALVGNIGAHRHYNFTAIGDTVNLAARITGAVPAGEVWLSQATREQLTFAVAVEPLPSLTFKGKSQPTPLFRALFN